jgi:hypothetical protein
MSRRESRLFHAAPRLLGALAIGLACCTSARENNEYPATAPATIHRDAQRKAIYNRGAVSNTPSAIPRSLNNQASEINRQQQIERRRADQPNNRPLEVRTEELGRPPVDTLAPGGLQK